MTMAAVHTEADHQQEPPEHQERHHGVDLVLGRDGNGPYIIKATLVDVDKFVLWLIGSGQMEQIVKGMEYRDLAQ